MKSVKELKVYKLAFQISLDIYKLTEHFPGYEQFGLSSQMRRAAVSICSNLAEGCGRGTTKEYLHFAYIAKGSAAELSCQVDLACALRFIKEPNATKLKEGISEVLKMLSGLISKLNDNAKLTTNTNH
jgi:four helix bundle protein